MRYTCYGRNNKLNHEIDHKYVTDYDEERNYIELRYPRQKYFQVQ